MENKYEPELGQMVYGQPFHEKKVSVSDGYALQAIRGVLEEIKGVDPFGNTGQDYHGNCFSVCAYDWSECVCGADADGTPCKCGYKPQHYNFKWRDFEVSWYKYFGRGMSCNKHLSTRLRAEMISEIIMEIISK